jgi:hypothetical protein
MGIVMQEFNRRGFLKQAAGTIAGGALSASLFTRGLNAAEPAARPKVAAIFTDFRHRHHPHVILENFLQPYLFNGKKTDPGVEVVSFYADQSLSGDMTGEVARQFDIPIYRSIGDALRLGGKNLAVDAVLLIGEHGDYPTNELGQVEYPRKRFFDESVAVMKLSDRFVPIFNDKHLSYRWDWAKEMYDTARKLGIPFMAGSSVPLAERKPPFELRAGTAIEEAISIHGGPVESYDFHAIEVLQSIVEARKGGETGISSVEFLEGEALRRAAAEGHFSRDLAEAAMANELGKTLPLFDQVPGEPAQPHAVLLRYKDGLKATILKIGASSTRWNFACRVKDDPKPQVTRFYVGPWNNRNLFKALSHAIQYCFIHKESPYPIERTLLATGVLDAEMYSRRDRKAIATPQLEFAYAARDFKAMREMGASWKIITDQTPETKGIVPVGL